MSKSKLKHKQMLIQDIEANDNKATKKLKELVTDGLGHWEGRVISFLARSKAYKAGNVEGMLEIANDLNHKHKTNIEFCKKYAGDLFTPSIALKNKESKVLGIEWEETEFLDEKVIPMLKDLL